VRVIVTRPQPQADEWVARLHAAGLAAAALPLLQIDAPADTAPVRQAWAALAQAALVVFVSPNAVDRFFALQPPGSAWPAATWAGSTGPGTSQALRRHGVPAKALVEPAADAGRFDSEGLWAELASRRDWRGAMVMIVRGEAGRDWLAGTLQAQGAAVRFVEAYRRAAPVWSDAEQALVRDAAAQPARHLWLFSSSEAIGHLRRLAPDACRPEALALATHPRIAATAQAAGFGRVMLVPPGVEATVQAVRACIQSPAP
jgi:uroporphyrinogen-III synthase